MSFVRFLYVLCPVTAVVYFLVYLAIVAQPPGPKTLVDVPVFQLFPPNANIFLTDDNSTFFPARPAAFGPELTEPGLSAVLWIGAGFGEDGVVPQGELGCSDVPGWDSRAAENAPILGEMDFDDHTDNYLEEFVAAQHHGSARESAPAEDLAGSETNGDGDGGLLHSDAQSPQEGAEIAGKIVLLRRGGCGFMTKVMWAQRRGAVAVIVGDDRKGGPLIQMYASGDTSVVHIPSVFATRSTAHLLTALAASALQNEEVKRLLAAAFDAVAHGRRPVSETDGDASQELQDDDEWFWRNHAREWVQDEFEPTDINSVASETGSVMRRSHTTVPGVSRGRAAHTRQLNVTLAPEQGNMPLADTLIVLVASPMLVVLTITSVVCFLRSQWQSRTCRAPKDLVDQLPVHVYRAPGAAPPSPILVPAGSEVASPNPSPPSSPTFEGMTPSVTTPLLPRSRMTTGVPADSGRTMVPVEVPPPPPSRFYQSECVVCLEDYVHGDLIMSLPCGHEYHAACITPWLTTRRSTCPICKGDIARGISGGGNAAS